ncbi:MAG: ABC-type transport auxiliary lipoprotein family protein [Bacteroidales bacterium]
MNRKSIGLPIVLLLMILAACRSSKPVEPRFYLLEFPSERIQADTLEMLPYVLEILPVDVHPAFASHQIAIRERSHELRYFSNHQWAVRPGQSLTRFVAEYFARTEIFQKTDTRFWTMQPDFKLKTSVYQLEVVRERNDFLAFLSVEFQLISNHDGSVMFSHTAAKNRLLEKRNLNLFAEAINRLFFEELNYFARKVHFGLHSAQ